MDDLLFKIPVHSHIKKFLAGHVSIEPFKVTTTNTYGTLLLLCLDKDPYQGLETRLDFNDWLTIRIPKRYTETHGVFLSNKKVILFNDMIERMMLKELHILLDACNKKVGDIKFIINDFREAYGINDTELEYHNLRKSYNRYRGLCK